jgi:ribonucleoside-triphosphate reductase (thioredoxin)
MLPTDYQSFIHLSKYARWRDDLQRRETWEETVQRYFAFFCNQLEQKLPYMSEEHIWKTLSNCKQAVLKLEVMPSMRAMMSSGPALEKDNNACYNCSYLAIDHPHAFDELMFILMCGSGAGFSVEKQYTSLLPTIAPKMYATNTTIVVEDDKIGWATAFRELLALLWTGKVPKWDTSKLRPAGARLVTFGGRASGPGPLEELFKFTVATFKGATGRKLTTLECHDIVCKIAEIVVSGGVRRSALISLSDLEDMRMRDSKTGEWWNSNGQRRLSNNSAVYSEKPPIDVFMDEWLSLYKSHSGERGFFNRHASTKQTAKTGRRKTQNDDKSPIIFGTNPCSEIILRNKGFCNLSEVIIRPEDTFDTVSEKVKYATILGTLQSTLTKFRYLSDEWETNAKEEHLLGVSMTGILDHPFFSGKENCLIGAGSEAHMKRLPEVLQLLKQIAIDTNKEWSEYFGIKPSVAITCVKPSGNVSQLVNSASGIHPRYSRYYIRRVRSSKNDPLSKLMREAGVPVEDDIASPVTDVFSFPIKSPDTAILREDMTALDQLKLSATYQKYWCEHKVSNTIYVREHEWLEVGAYVYKNFDEMSGLAFLPYDTGTYRQAPYEEITFEQYNDLVSKMPKDIDWKQITKYETEDQTTNTKELACSGTSCEL